MWVPRVLLLNWQYTKVQPAINSYHPDRNIGIGSVLSWLELTRDKCFWYSKKMVFCGGFLNQIVHTIVSWLKNQISYPSIFQSANGFSTVIAEIDVKNRLKRFLRLALLRIFLSLPWFTCKKYSLTGSLLTCRNPRPPVATYSLNHRPYFFLAFVHELGFHQISLRRFTWSYNAFLTVG